MPTPAAIALDEAVTLAKLPSRRRLRVSGPDRLDTFQNLTTNEIKRREVGTGCEAFVTEPKGRTLAFITVLALDEALLIRTEAPCLSNLMPHLEKYAALDDTEIEDVTELTFEQHFAGPKAEALLEALGAPRVPDPELAHVSATIGQATVRLVREAPLGRHGFSVIGASSDEEAVVRAIHEAGAAFGLTTLSEKAIEAFRIEAGTPTSGVDVTNANLPQEIDRNDRAISFVKGCYLGQEPVARLDALGHVNRLLRRLTIDSDAPLPPGTSLFEPDGEKEIGRITSSAVSERTGQVIALGLLRVKVAEAGTKLRAKTADDQVFDVEVETRACAT